MTENLTPRRVAFHTLGCKLNFAESSSLGRELAGRGFLPVKEGERPDLIVVNTCSVTEVADKKGRRLIRHLHHEFPDAKLVVTGCYAQLKPSEVNAIEGVDAVFGNHEKMLIGRYLDRVFDDAHPVEVTPVREIFEFHHSCERGNRTRYFLKVQDGCDYYCTYCTIPYARGRSRSPEIAPLVATAEQVAREGGREIVLTGVNIGDFGRGGKKTFFDLIRALDAVEGIERYRISSIEPNLLTPEIIRWVATEARKFMPHFHIPLQAGSDKVLRLMNRRYTTDLFRSRIELVRELLPDAFIGVDVIAGARGEGEREWEESYNFISSLDVSRLHAFPYSERAGTAALLIEGKVPQEVKHRRIDALTRLSDSKLLGFVGRFDGQRRPVLWEQPSHADRGVMHGLTDNNLRVEAPYDPALINTITTETLKYVEGSELMLALRPQQT